MWYRLKWILSINKGIVEGSPLLKKGFTEIIIGVELFPRFNAVLNEGCRERRQYEIND